MREIWKDIPEYIGHYQISNHGRIKSLHRTISYGSYNRTYSEKILSVGSKKSRYATTKLVKNGVYKSYLIHRLVALSFVGKVEGKPFVNHKDGNGHNNHHSNLEWSTHPENIQHAYDTGLIVKRNCKGNPKLTHEDVYFVKTLLNIGENQKSIAERFEVDQSTISNINNGKHWSTVKLEPSLINI